MRLRCVILMNLDNTVNEKTQRCRGAEMKNSLLATMLSITACNYA